MHDMRDRDVVLCALLVSLGILGLSISYRLPHTIVGTAVAMSIFHLNGAVLGAGILAPIRQKILGAILGLLSVTAVVVHGAWPYV
jgi:hypothetical protein